LYSLSFKKFRIGRTVNARALCAEDLEFKYQTGQILHSVANGSSSWSLLQHLYTTLAVLPWRYDAEVGTAVLPWRYDAEVGTSNSLHAFAVIQRLYNEMLKELLTAPQLENVPWWGKN